MPLQLPGGREPVLGSPLSVSPVQPMAPVNLRATDDPDALRNSVYDGVLQAASTMDPVVGPTHTLAVRDVHYAKDDPKYTKADQKRAILERTSLSRRLRGTWDLIDNATGESVDTRTATLANVPAILHDGTFLNKGTRYAMGYQQRLRPGMYVRTKKDGALETHVNTRVGTGSSHRYVLTPETGKFHLNVGHAKIPLVPLLETLGASKEQMIEAWGEDLYKKNIDKVDGKSIGKLYDRLVPKRLQDKNDRGDAPAMRAKIREAFQDMQVDSEVVEKTMGRGSDVVDANMILRATRETLALSRGERKDDDRDHLAFATFHSAPDIFAERFKKDYGNLRRDMLRKVARKGNLQTAPPSSILDRQIQSAIFKSGLAQTVEEINPQEILTAMTRVTRFGEGGLPDTTAVPDESRNVGLGQFGFIDPVMTPESLRVGVDGYLAKNTFIGDDNKLYTEVNNREGKSEIVDAGKLIGATFSLGQVSIKGRELAVKNGKLEMVRPEEVDYKIPDPEQMFGHGGGMTPMKSAQFGQRSSMAMRMAAQALAVDNAEAPLVQTGVPGSDDDSFEARAGKTMGSIRPDEGGRVLKVTPDAITVRYDGGRKETFDLDNNRPGARKSVFHQEALLKPGEAFKPGQAIVKSNYTDKDGVAALGLNLRTALIPWGDNWEDGIGVSESAAARMRVQQSYKHTIDKGEGTNVDKRGFLTRFGNTYNSDQLSKMGDDGIVKVGQTVSKGDPLILGLRERNGVKSRVHKTGKTSWGDASVKWTHNHDGVVTDIVNTPKGANVVVRSSSPLEVGSKISGRQGNKGVVAIVPDAEMPQDKDGNPIEMTISPLAVPSRGNSSFPLEMLLAKVARKRGKAYRIQDFDGKDMRKYVEDEAKAHNVDQTETLIDPRTGRKIPKVFTGDLFTMALSHTAESKASARGLGKYTATGEPARGKGEGNEAKRVSGQELYAHLSHGAYDLSKESSLLRGRRNDDYWAGFMSGKQIQTPRVPEQYTDFVDRLQASGIRPVRKGSKTQVMALTDKDVKQLAGHRKVLNSETVDLHKDLQPIKGGLHDPAIFGEGDKFASFDLPQKMPNPVFEEPIRRMLGLTEKQFRGVLGGTHDLEGFGSGPAALAKKLEGMNLKTELATARKQVKSTKRTERDAAVRRLTYLKGLEKSGVTPGDLMISSVPVLPPKYRPISQMSGKGGVSVEDSNFLYTELIKSAENVSSVKEYMDDTGDENLAMYDAHKALVGLTDPVSHELKQRKVKGLLKTILGKSTPKNSMMQRKLLSGTADTIGRGVIMVDSSLDMDEAGIPENMAFDMFQPYIIRNLVQNGVSRVDALEQVKDRTDKARAMLAKEMDRRPVTITRAPVLHRGGIQGFKPVLIKGDAIRLPPMSYSPFGGDNDGDAVNVNIPHSPEAVSEVKNRMLPSKSLISEKDFKSPNFAPSQDHVLGLYQASKGPDKKKRVRVFASWADAEAAMDRGDIDVDQEVKIMS